MYCPACGGKNPEQADFCMGCGKNMEKTNAHAPRPQTWGNIALFTGLFIVAMIGNYLHPMVEITAIAFFAVIVTTGWIYADSQKYRMNHAMWTLFNLFLWIFTFPIYLWKTRSWQGLAPGAAIVAVVVGMQIMPPLYSASKHFRRGVRFSQQQRLTPAENEFKLAISKDARMGEAHLNLGLLYMSQGFLDAAEKELLKAKDLIDAHGVKLLDSMTREQALALCLANLSAVYAMRTSEAIQILDRQQARLQFQKAKEYADAAINFDPDNVRPQELQRRLKSLATFLE